MTGKRFMAKRFQGQADFQHGRSSAMGVLLVNLGTPDQIGRAHV